MSSETHGVRVLVVDDEETLIDDYRYVLVTGSSQTKSGKFAELERDLFGATANEREFPKVDLLTACQGQEAIRVVAQSRQEGRPISVAFIDLRMPPGMNGLTTAAKIRELDPTIQIVIVSAYSDLSVLDLGERVPPADRIFFLQKPFHSIEIQQLVVALSAKWRLESLVEAVRPPAGQSTVQHVEEDYGDLRTFPDALMVFDKRNLLFSMSESVAEIFPSFCKDLTLGMPYHKVCSLIAEAQRSRSGSQMNGEHTGTEASRTNGTIAEIELFDARRVLWVTSDTESDKTFCQFFDVTDLRSRQLERTQSSFLIHLSRAFAAISEGLASAISCHQVASDTDITEMEVKVRKNKDKLDHVQGMLEAIRAIGQRQRLDIETVQLEEAVVGVARSLRKSLAKGISLEVVCGVGIWSVLADRDQLLRCVKELVSNARDALRERGSIYIELTNIRLDKRFTNNFMGLRPGEYVRLSVNDDGRGMDQDIYDRSLMPFFSSKGDGHLGLGLSVIYGWVRQSGGHLDLRSSSGAGTRVDVYLPRAMKRGDAKPTNTVHALDTTRTALAN